MSKKINIRREVRADKTNSHWTKIFKNYSAAWLFRNIFQFHMKSAFEIIFIKQTVELYHIIYFFFFGSGQEYCLSQQVKTLLQERRRVATNSSSTYRNMLGKESQQD